MGEVMGLFHSPKIITDGLVLSLDYANAKCIDQDASVETCKNLVNLSDTGGEGIDASYGGSTGTHTPDAGLFMHWFNHPDVGGVMEGATNDGVHFEENYGHDAGECTFQFWMYKSSNAVDYLFDARGGDYGPDPQGGGIYCLSNYVSANINCDNTLNYNFSSSYNASDSKFINRWLCIAITGKTSENGLIYINGEEITNNSQGLHTSYVSQNAIDTNIGRRFRIGHRYNGSFTNPFTGYMGPWMIYTRKLSSAEIMQNFQAFRGRFGL